MTTKTYLKLNGMPPGLPWSQEILRAPATRGAALGGVASLALMATANMSNLGAIVTGSGLGYVLAFGAAAGIDWAARMQMIDLRQRLRIDPAPDEKTPPTSARNMNTARDIVWRNWASLSLMIPVTGALGFIGYQITRYNANNDYVSAVMASGLTLSSGMISQLFNEASRFAKVARREWVIVDAPREQEKPQEKPASILPHPWPCRK